ncbi:hypothetical protein BY996DRAFT_6409963 [Phakopsora pachyrhizi]|nr:hypothetical protein BY996DRAFT_6409963 [Phakopsora pachyrhizi]
MKRVLDSNQMDNDENPTLSKLRRIENVKMENTKNTNTNTNTRGRENNSNTGGKNFKGDGNNLSGVGVGVVSLEVLNNSDSVLKSSRDQRPDAKAQRYDRQLRLWEKSGQNRLENSTITIGPSSSTTSQILKNLILPGLGSFRLFDSSSISRSDLGNDFFLELEDYLGERGFEEQTFRLNRARQITKCLVELNPDVRASVFEEDLVDLKGAEEDEGWFNRKVGSSSLVIGVRLNEAEELKLSEECWKNDLPLILVQSFGFNATVSVQFKERTIIETHPDSFVDLRIDCPFPSLTEYVNSFDFKSMDGYDHSHIPAVVILIHFLNIYKSNNSNNLPKTSKEKLELKNIILKEKRNPDEENFEEAISMISKACKPTKIPTNVERLFLDPKCESIGKDSTPFWILVQALKRFVSKRRNQPCSKEEDKSDERIDDEEGSMLLPLTGVLPDLRSDSKSYIDLLRIYEKRSREDLIEFKKILNEVMVEKKLNMLDENDENINEYDKNKSSKNGDKDEDSKMKMMLKDLRDDEFVKTFVKNSAYLKLIRVKWLLLSVKGLKAEIESIKQQGLHEEGEDHSGLSIFLASRVLLKFRESNQSRFPGRAPTGTVDEKMMKVSDEGQAVAQQVGEFSTEEDFEKVKRITIDYLSRFGFYEDGSEMDLGINGDDDGDGINQKFEGLPKVRSGGVELPQISSLIGGIVSQESIKLISNQYIPLVGNLIFDGIRSSTNVFF